MYIGIVSIMLTMISYVIIDIVGTQTRGNAQYVINQNARMIIDQLRKDIRLAQTIKGSTSSMVTVDTGTDDIIYTFTGSNTFTRSFGTDPTYVLHDSFVSVSGFFDNASFTTRSKNITGELTVSYNNPGNDPKLDASTTISFGFELHGRK
jgi:type II secretory pathway pseudopilin PulG